MNGTTGAAQAAAPPSRPRGPETQRYRSEQLFFGQKEIEILHGETLYRLRITSLGKLILNK